MVTSLQFGGSFIPTLHKPSTTPANPTDRSRWIIHTPSTYAANNRVESHRPQSVDRSYPTYNGSATRGIPPTAAGASFIPHATSSRYLLPRSPATVAQPFKAGTESPKLLRRVATLDPTQT